MSNLLSDLKMVVNCLNIRGDFELEMALEHITTRGNTLYL